MPFSFLDLITWAKYRDFDQVVDKDSVYGFPKNLLDLARFLDKGQLRSLSGIRAGLNVKGKGQALKIKTIKEKAHIFKTP